VTAQARFGTGSEADRQPGRPRRQLHALTGLRLVAALAVYFSHLPAPRGAPGWLLAIQQSGYAGVTFFFVLSGFVVTLNYFDTLRTPRQVWAYTVARLARVYPLYLVVLAWPAVHLWAAGTLPKYELLLHVLGVQAWHPDPRVLFPFIQPSWSISVELFLYATLPVLVAIVRLVDRRIWTIVGSLLLVLIAVAALAYFFEYTGRAALHPADPASAHRWLYRMPLLRIGDFLLGILAARLYLRLRDRRLGVRLGHWLVPVAVGTTLVAAAQPSLVFSAWSWDAMYALPATGLILGLGLAPRAVISRLLALRAVVFLGEASFAFYLVHHPIVVGLGAGTWSSGVSARSLAVEAVNLGLAVAVAIGLHVGVEKPGRTIVKRMLDRPTTPRAAPTTRQRRPDGPRGSSRHDLRHPEMTPPGPEPLDGATARMPVVDGDRGPSAARVVPALSRR
jgi:peptidoglycan/LPS O-acetylase OafA/YrhL